MASRCVTNEYFDSLLLSCKPCHLRCPKIPRECKNPCPGVSGTAIHDIPCIIWILLVMLVLLISIVSLGTIILHRSRKRKLHRDSLQIASECIIKNTDKERNSVESACNGVKILVVENEEEQTVGIGLSDYLFPLPAVEEGAAILVTTKTSASFNSNSGVREDDFVKIS
ncbi:tumor necrosis factor receptor superfamily member 17 [Pyxicephalus adspersus]|uniref:tumor necrosis factor receptor superfamily member 17 n=1 Tax=Pyxicephalus adspersus TaxID=30357 RepID=UPI003B5910E0